MKRIHKPGEPQGRERGQGAPRRHLGRGAAGLLAAGVLSLLPLLAVHAQGDPSAMVQQLQNRVSSLTRTVQRLNSQLSTERRLRTQQQQQISTATQRLQRAINSAAAAGDPTARAIRTGRIETELQKLAIQFEAVAGQARARRNVPESAAEEIEPADLSGAKLSGAVLHAAKLVKANLQGADLRNADLTNAALPGANFHAAKLQGTILTGADLARAELKDALYDAQTRWPDGFDPEKSGALLVR
jgi:hypothetical protein